MYNPAEGNFYFSDDALEAERIRSLSPSNTMTPQEKHDIQVMFCGLLAKGQTIGKAVQIINGSDDYVGGKHQRVARKTLYMWRKFDDVFRDAWDEAYQLGTEMLEQKASEVALEGNPTLLIHMMKTRNPRRHAIQKTEISGPGGVPIATVTAIELVGVEAEDGQEAAPDDESTGPASG